MTEEMKDPYRNLPRAIYISLPLATGIYFLANVGYMAVLTPKEIIATDAIAVVSCVFRLWQKIFNLLKGNHAWIE